MQERICWADDSDDEACEKSTFAPSMDGTQDLDGKSTGVASSSDADAASVAAEADAGLSSALNAAAPEFVPASACMLVVFAVPPAEALRPRGWRPTPLDTRRRPQRQELEEAEPVSEETWQKRIAERAHRIALVKETREYQLLRGSQGDALREPLTPDATDRSASKRHFKYLLAVWRKELVDRCGRPQVDEVACHQ